MPNPDEKMFVATFVKGLCAKTMAKIRSRAAFHIEAEEVMVAKRVTKKRDCSSGSGSHSSKTFLKPKSN
ncbi:hypothetical protein CR513_39826, partial [Mucuna pruriens]